MRTMAKHSFNADDDAESVLTTVEQVLRDKTEFLNRLIVAHGQAVIQSIMRERQDTLHKLSVPPPPQRIPRQLRQPPPRDPPRRFESRRRNRPRPRSASPQLP